mmetsp:Transcript_64627/g.148007  ORF Transcript_64627/g.148007 Transcript_64627/m.148007 type:complete len:224 (+) Transcript_64627:380-1051(+)
MKRGIRPHLPLSLCLLTPLTLSRETRAAKRHRPSPRRSERRAGPRAQKRRRRRFSRGMSALRKRSFGRRAAAGAAGALRGGRSLASQSTRRFSCRRARAVCRDCEACVTSAWNPSVSCSGTTRASSATSGARRCPPRRRSPTCFSRTGGGSLQGSTSTSWHTSWRVQQTSLHGRSRSSGAWKPPTSWRQCRCARTCPRCTDPGKNSTSWRLWMWRRLRARTLR